MDNHRILQAGDLVQWYRIEKVLGRGGFGVTYLATDTNLDHKVAIKEYMPGWAVERLEDNSLQPLNEEVRQDFDLGVASFLREARTLVKFRHPNIVRVMTVFEANNTAYLVMEYEEGEEFKSYVQRGDGTDEHSLKTLILRIVDGLDQVHQYGFLHRDIKPVNLIIRNDGSPVLLDFGAARPTDGEAGAHTSFVSAGYTPIEQYQEGEGMQVGPWTDIYALGATLYYAISGETPIGPTGRLAALVSKSPDPLVPARQIGADRYSDAFLEAIDWALSFRPNDRPRDLSEWRNAIGDTDTGHTTETVQRFSQQPDGVGDSSNPGYGNPGFSNSGDRSSAQARKGRKRTDRRSSVGRLAAVLVSGVAVLLASGWLVRDYQQRSELDALLRKADSEFGRGAYVDGALPLYREVLTQAQDHPRASSRVQEIEKLVSQQIDTAIGAGEIELAEQSLGDLEKISSDAGSLNAFQQRISSARQSRVLESQFNEALSLNAAGKHQLALELIDDLRTQRPDDPRIAEIEASASNALEASRALQEQQAAKQAAQQRAEEATRKRIAEAKKRQQARRATYDNYLREAEAALSEGDIASARQWLDDARALQVSDSRLETLESRVVEQENYQRKPLSEYEVSYAKGQFNALRSAVESKNRRAMDALTEGTSSRNGLLEILFGKYTRLEAQVVDVKSGLDPKRVTALLRIEAMILPNGDIAYPSVAYRDSELTINRQRYGWSRIVW